MIAYLEVTSRWLLGNHQAENDELHVGGAAEMFGQDDVDDLARALVFILFTEPPRAPSTSRGGRHVEYGFALARRPSLTGRRTPPRAPKVWSYTWSAPARTCSTACPAWPSTTTGRSAWPSW